MFSAIIRARLRRLIRQQRIPQEQLSQALGVHRDTVGRMLSGHVSDMSLSTVDQLLAQLDLPPSALEQPVEPDETELEILRRIDSGRSAEKLGKNRIADLENEGSYLRRDGELLKLTDLAQKVI